MFDRRWSLTLAAMVGIAIPAVWVLSLISPGEEAVKIRNGLVASVGAPADFEWTPQSLPPSFRANQAQPSEQYRQAVAQLAKVDADPPKRGKELALAISRHLSGEPGKRAGGPIQSSLEAAYTGITRNRRGYCADFTQVFTGLAIAAGLPVRTWSISFETFGAGHAFNEIYDADLAKWVLIDPFHSLYFIDPTSLEPLSVIEVHDRLLALNGESRPIAIQRITDGRLPFRSEELAIEYYRRGMSQLALAWGNNVFDYDQSPPVRWSAAVSRHLERAVAILIGKYPSIRIYPKGVSQRDVDGLFRARDRFVLAMSAFLVACGVFGAMLLATWRRRKTP
jgi:hypothetical protein